MPWCRIHKTESDKAVLPDQLDAVQKVRYKDLSVLEEYHMTTARHLGRRSTVLPLSGENLLELSWYKSFKLDNETKENT